MFPLTPFLGLYVCSETVQAVGFSALGSFVGGRKLTIKKLRHLGTL